MSEQFYTSTLKKRRRQGQTLKPEQRIKAQATFLAAYEHTANVLRAAEQAEIDRTLVYYWLEHDENFHFAYHIADEAANKHIEAEIRRRAIEGWDEPLISAGKRLGTVRKYSDVLLMFYAKKRIPEYRDKQQSDVTIHNGQAKDIAAIHDAIATALADYPEARAALAEQLASMEKSRGGV